MTLAEAMLVLELPGPYEDTEIFRERLVKARKRAARKYHPDLNNAPDAPAKFKEAMHAAEVLEGGEDEDEADDEAVPPQADPVPLVNITEKLDELMLALKAMADRHAAVRAREKRALHIAARKAEQERVAAEAERLQRVQEREDRIRARVRARQAAQAASWAAQRAADDAARTPPRWDPGDEEPDDTLKDSLRELRSLGSSGRKS